MNVDGDVKVVNFLKAKKIEHDKLTAAIAQQEAQLKTDTFALHNFEEKVASGIPLEKAMATEMTNASAAAKKYALETKGVAGSTDEFVAKQKAAQTELRATATASKGTTVALKALAMVGSMLATFAAAEVLSLAVKAFDNYIHKNENAIKLTEELNSKYSELNSKYESHKKTVDELAASYEKLSEGVDSSTNKNLSLSDEDYKSYLDITKKLSEEFPSLYQTLDDNGNAILTLGQNGRTASEDLKELLQAEENLNNYKISQDIAGLFGGVKVKVEEASAALQEYNVESQKIDDTLNTIKNISENGFDFSSDDYTISVDTSSGDGVKYYNALTAALKEFNKELDGNRLSELNGDFDVINVATQKADNENAYNFYLKLWELTDEEKNKLQEKIKEQADELMPILEDDASNAFQSKSQKQQEADLAWKDFVPSLVATMKSKGSFSELANGEFGEDIQKFAVDFVSNLNSSVASEMDANDPYAWVREHVILPLTQLDDSDREAVSDAYSKLLELNPNDLSEENQNAIEKIVQQIANLLKLNPIDVRLNLGFKIDENLKSKYDTAVSNSVSQLGITKKETESMFTELGIDTSKEIDRWNDIIKYVKDATEAKKRYLNTNAPSSKSASTTEVISGINAMSAGFEKLDKIMDSIKEKDKVFDYSLLDDKDLKEKFGGYTKEYGKFITTITKSPKDINACQDAFNDLATAYVYAQPIMKQLSDDTADVAIQYLKLMGIENSAEVVAAALAEKHAQVAWNSRDLSNATAEEIQQLAAESETTESGRKAFQAYIAQKLMDSALDTSADIDALNNVMVSLGLATGYWKQYYAAKKDLDYLSNARVEAFADGDKYKSIYTDKLGNYLDKKNGKYYYSGTDEEYSGSTQKRVITDLAEKQIQENASNYLQNAKDDIVKQVKVDTKYTGPKSTNPQKGSSGSSGSKGAKDNSTIDWIKRSAELLERESTRLQNAIDDTWKAYTGLSQADIERVQELFSMNLTPNSDEVNELLDYADKLGVSIGELQDLANNNGLESRQSLLDQLIDVDKQRLDQGIDSLNYYKNSYEEYVSKVPEYRDKIENGGIDIESFSGDEKTKIENAMNAYDSYLDQKKTNLELSNTIRDNELEYYTIAINEIDKKNARLSSSNDLIQKQIDLLNTQGITVSSSMYDQLISNTEGQIGYQQEKLQKQKDQLIKAITEEDLKVGSDKWYELNDEIMSTEGSIKDLEKAQAEYEKQLRELPITNLEKLGTIYQSILDTIQNWGAEMEASGKTLDADYYQKLINNANTSISNYKEEIEAIQDVMEDYNPGTDNWNEMNDKLQQCNSSISSLVQNMHKWNEELLKLPIDKISDASDSLSKIVDGLNDVKSEHETVISAVTGAISDEIDRLNDEKEAYEDTINDQKEALQDRMDLLDKQNEKLKLQAQYEQALYDLENATTQKTEKVIRNGELTYEANADNLRNAQESVQDSLAALKKQELQDQMDALDDALDDYNDKLQDTLDSLQKISDKWSEIASKKEQADNEKTATDILGKNWKDKVLSGNDNDIFQMFSKLYSDNVDQINKYQEQIDSTEHISSLIQEYIDSYKAGTLTYEEAQAGIHDLVSQMNQKMSAMDNLQNIYNYMGKVYDTAADGDAVFGGIQKAFKESGDQLISSLQQYQANAGLISESMSSWQQLTNNVESIKDILEDVKDNLKDTERDSDSKKDKDDNVRGSGNSRATGKHSSKSVYGSSGFSAEKHHSGVFSGAVGSSSADKTDKIRVLEAEKLEPNEVPAVLERGEMVFTPEQMEKLVASFSATAYVPDNSWIKNMYPSATVNTKPNIVNVSVGDVKLTDVRDVDGFAKAMGKDFVPLARQALARF